jgi:hypothetical protein
VAPGSRPQGLCCLVDIRQPRATGFTSPWVPSTCYSVPGAHYHTPKEPGFAILLAKRLPSQQSMGGQHFPLSLTAREPLLSHQRARTPDSPTEGRKAVTCYSASGTRSPVSPKVHRSPVLHTAPLCRTATSLLSKSWNPSSSIGWQSATLLVLEGLPLTVHKDPALPTVTAGEPLHPYKRAGTIVPSLKGEKR